MKVEISFLATLLLIGTDLLARAAVQGVEQALLATAIEYGMGGMRKGLRQLSNILKFRRYIDAHPSDDWEKRKVCLRLPV